MATKRVREYRAINHFRILGVQIGLSLSLQGGGGDTSPLIVAMAKAAAYSDMISASEDTPADDLVRDYHAAIDEFLDAVKSYRQPTASRKVKLK